MKKTIKSTSLNPFKHQLQAINKTVSYFTDKKNTRGKIIMPCGSGKSLTSYWVLEQLKKKFKIKRSLITVPNLILEKQIFETFHSNSNKKCKFICIGSDKDVAEGVPEGFPIEVTTNKERIKSFLISNKNNEVIVIATLQSLINFSEALNEVDFSFDFAIIDEAHRTVGNEDKSFSYVLFDKNIEISRRLFMTATEKIYSGKDDTVIAMDNVEYYGKTIYEYTLGEAIKEGVLCDYKVYGLATKEEVKEFIKANPYLKKITNTIKLSNEEKENILFSLVATFNSIKRNGSKKIVTYHSTINKARLFQVLIRKVSENNKLNIGTFHVNGSQPSKERNNNMNGFKNASIAVLTNSQALVEGVDIPCIDCIVFCDKRESTIGVVQAVGRALRKYKGKKLSSILIPYLFKSEKDDGSESEFSKLTNILTSLNIMDERITHELKELRDSNGGGERSIDMSKRILQDVFDIDSKFHPNVNKILGKIYLRVLQRVKELFYSYEEAKKWVKQNDLTKKIKKGKEWRKIQNKLPSFIPKDPYYYYDKVQKTWKGWDDFLETGKLRVDYENLLNYEEAKKWIRKNKLKNANSISWNKLTLPPFIPKYPSVFYSKTKEWKGWGDFLGTGTIGGGASRKILNYEEAKKWLRKNKLFKGFTLDDYLANKHNLPPFMPNSPYSYYKNRGWKGWNDFIGTKPKSERYLSFDEAKKWIAKNKHTKNIKSSEVWLTKKIILPDFIPRNPSAVYEKKGWKNWADWFGKGFLDYEKSKEWLRKDSFFKKIKTQDEWAESTHKLPFFITKAPSHHFKKTKEWKGWGDWLGTGNLRDGNFLKYKDAKKWVQENELTKNLNSVSWKKLTNLPSFIPKNVIQYYDKTKEWKGWDDWFGRKEIKYLSYEEAKKWAKENNLSKYLKDPYESEWSKIKNKLDRLLPLNFPKSPRTFYRKNGTWKGWVDFLNVEKRNILNYEDTKKWIHKNKLTKNINSEKDWDKIKYKLPLFISKDPLTYFLRQGTWKGWGDFLGTGRK